MQWIIRSKRTGSIAGSIAELDVLADDGCGSTAEPSCSISSGLRVAFGGAGSRALVDPTISWMFLDAAKLDLETHIPIIWG